MKRVFVSTLTGHMPNRGASFLRINASEVLGHRGPAIAARLERYCAAVGGASPLRLMGTAAGIVGHIEANEERLTAVLGDASLSASDRAEFAEFLATSSMKLKRAYYGRRPLAGLAS